MHVIKAGSPDEALHSGLHWLHVAGVTRDSRNGLVKASPTPVTTVFYDPKNRVSFDERRDANPFFHFFEALWMIAGKNDVAIPSHFAKQLTEYSDDGVTLNGAYGYRWRNHFMIDQIEWVVRHLSANPNSRRAVIQMWDAIKDPDMVDLGGKDVPCNTQIYFNMNNGALDMTVTCRSNDLVWGLAGANIVHFSTLLEYIAARLEQKVGTYYHISNDYHIYLDNPVVKRLHMENGYPLPIEFREYAAALPLFDQDEYHAWMEDLSMIMQVIDYVIRGEDVSGWAIFKTFYFNHVVVPMFGAHWNYKLGEKEAAFFDADGIADDAWRIAAVRWLERRKWS